MDTEQTITAYREPKPRRLTAMVLAVVLGLLIAPSAFAQDTTTDADVNVGVNVINQIPIAVANGQPGGGADASIGEEAGNILRRDFTISGYFEVISPSSFLPGLAEEGVEPANTDYSNWYNTGAEAVVKIAYTVDGKKVKFDFRLYDTAESKPIRLTYEAEGATTENIRPAVHAFANAVIKYYSGADGIFGQQLLVVRKARKKGQSHVYRIGVDGAGLSKVSSGSTINMLPTWGPGGTVLYTSYGSGNPDLVSSDGTTLSSSSGMNSGADYCSRNGRVAVTLGKDDNPEIYTMNADGSDLTRLTDNSYIDTSPTWSRDCSRLAFVSNRGGSPQIYVMNADGSGSKLVTSVGSYNTSPSWGPKGSKIAFTGRDEYNVFDIFVVDADSGYIERLTQDQGNNEEPTWSPDGNYLAFTSTRDGGSKLFIMTADGRFQTAITDGGGYETPTWH